ncbi:MAG: hypothetical protein AB8B50_18360 [Pirellulaceae bacterium]
MVSPASTAVACGNNE